MFSCVVLSHLWTTKCATAVFSAWLCLSTKLQNACFNSLLCVIPPHLGKIQLLTLIGRISVTVSYRVWFYLTAEPENVNHGFTLCACVHLWLYYSVHVDHNLAVCYVLCSITVFSECLQQSAVSLRRFWLLSDTVHVCISAFIIRVFASSVRLDNWVHMAKLSLFIVMCFSISGISLFAVSLRFKEASWHRMQVSLPIASL